MIEITFFLKSKHVVKIVCEKFKINQDGFGNTTGYEWSGGIGELPHLLFVAPEDVSAVVSVHLPAESAKP